MDSIISSKKKIMVYNALFVIFCMGIFLFLWYAPPETTARLPHDKDHERFMTMDKKEAEKSCPDCHGEKGVSPLPPTHPPKYRCLFCHKRDER